KYPRYPLRAAVLGQAGHGAAVQRDTAFVGLQTATHHVEQGGLAGAIGADNGDKIAGFQFDVNIDERNALVDAAGKKSLLQLRDFKHDSSPSNVCALLPAPGSGSLDTLEQGTARQQQC